MGKILVGSLTGVALTLATSMAQAVPTFEDVLSRGIFSATFFYDSVEGNGYDRQDLFINTSSNYRVRLDSVQFIYLDPAEVGIPNLEASNYFPTALSAAESAHPPFDFWGGAWWGDLDPITVTWQNSLSIQDLGGIVLDPGYSTTIHHLAHNNITTNTDSPDDIGELLVGFKFVGDISPVPEPATLALMGLGLAGIGFARKRKQA